MIDDRPSKTAFRVALRRAAHQVLDDPRVFDDPLAVAIVGADAAELRSDPRGRTRLGRAMRAFMAARSRFAEDSLAEAVAGGVRQYVVLGAGLDTFAYRNPHGGLRVFEVDHPSTQAMKRHRLAEAGIAIPESLTFVPIDFEKRTLAEALRLAGFLTGEPAFFSWLGVVPYLAKAAVSDTLRFVASLPPGTEIVCDYAVDPSALNWVQRAALRALADRVAAAGEPFRSYFVPAELRETLGRLGFDGVEDNGAAELNSRYFAGRADGLVVRGGIGRLLKAG
jgi:methyltransferase (TIGR00027 family)